ncbi:MAG: long-chain fatty acid--CoA ligase [Mariprofundaceae bacterium]|nr:long-chain fatty acid--CoA ligase [Mariprofundaceae bacterium]
MNPKAPPALELVTQANCLSDLLLHSPSHWMEKPMLSYRTASGWKTLNRITIQQRVLRVAAWLESKGVKTGDRVGILGHNSVEWFIADLAILRIGGVTVPAYFTDPAEAVQYVFTDAGCSLLLVEPGEQHDKIKDMAQLILPLRGSDKADELGKTIPSDAHLELVSRDDRWDVGPQQPTPTRQDLATLIYTSGTTGHPKGVMLSHGNLLANVASGLGAVPILDTDKFLSFLPVSHAFERTIGHFLPLASGAEIAYAEDVTTLLRDMPEARPTIMISVPRLYEKIYAGVQAKLAQGSLFKRFLFNTAQNIGLKVFQKQPLSALEKVLYPLLDSVVNAKLRAKMGGNLRLFISGGASLNPSIAKFLLAANITVLPGYGLTEASPVLCVNPESDIRPESVGPALPGVTLKVADDGELLAKSASIMSGYWQKDEATAEVIDADGWLHTGDIVVLDDDGYVRIVDRKKEIMVLSNGENVPPAIVEQHLTHDPCILQALVIGEQRPYLSALLVLEPSTLAIKWMRDHQSALPTDWLEHPDVQTWLQQRLQHCTHDLPSYQQIKRFTLLDKEWTQNNGFLTPTMKVKRRAISSAYADMVENMYD